MRIAIITLLAVGGGLTLAGCDQAIVVEQAGSRSVPTDSKWADHMGDVPFVVSSAEAGLELARQKGKPPLYFFTATW